MTRALVCVLLVVCSLVCIVYGAGPTQVHLSLGQNETEMVVMWITQTNESSVVLYGDSDGNTYSVTGNYTTYNYDGSYDYSYTSPLIHTAVMVNLKPATKYWYSIGSGSTSFSAAFVSPPALGSTAPIVIGYIGDVGTDYNSMNTIDALTNAQTNFVFHVGDLAYDNGDQQSWDAYGSIVQGFAQSIPYLPAVGNHEDENFENSFLPFSARYNLPLHERWANGGPYYYSFNYGMIHFISLSSETDYYSNSTQYAWLQQDLANVDRSVTPWLLAGWHRPWYNSNHAHRHETDDMRMTMETLLYNAQVDLVVTGHVHAYERCTQVYQEQVTPGAPYYVTNGMGGAPDGLAVKWEDQPDWSVFRYSDDYGYSKLQIFNVTHAHWTMHTNSNGQVDDFWIVKS